VDPDPDPGGPKTYGSDGFGSAALIFFIIHLDTPVHLYKKNLFFLKQQNTEEEQLK
jgi:hypothetical protein